MSPENLRDESASEATENSFSRFWWWCKVAWTIVRNFVLIVLILLAFSKASTPFEHVVLSVLLLILQSVTWGHTTQLRLAIEEAFSTKRLLFKAIKMEGEDIEDAEQIIDEAEKKYLKGNTLYYINSVGASLIYLIILWNLFTTLLLQ
jgi:hypothetical protein